MSAQIHTYLYMLNLLPLEPNVYLLSLSPTNLLPLEPNVYLLSLSPTNLLPLEPNVYLLSLSPTNLLPLEPNVYLLSLSPTNITSVFSRLIFIPCFSNSSLHFSVRLAIIILPSVLQRSRNRLCSVQRLRGQH